MTLLKSELKTSIERMCYFKDYILHENIFSPKCDKWKKEDTNISKTPHKKYHYHILSSGLVNLISDQ